MLKILGKILFGIFFVFSVCSFFIDPIVNLEGYDEIIYKISISVIFLLIAFGFAITFNLFKLKAKSAFFSKKLGCLKMWGIVFVLICLVVSLPKLLYTEQGNVAWTEYDEKKDEEDYLKKQKESEEKEQKEKLKQEEAAQKEKLEQEETAQKEKLEQEEKTQKEKEEETKKEEEAQRQKELEEQQKAEEAKILDLQYYKEDYSKKKASITESIVEENYKGQNVEWTGYVKKVSKHSITIQSGDLPEIRCDFSDEEGNLKDKNISQDDLVTVHGTIDKYKQGWFFFSSYWSLENCKLKETTKDIEFNFLDAFRNPKGYKKDESIVDKMKFIEINEEGNLKETEQMSTSDINQCFDDKYVKWTVNFYEADELSLTLRTKSHSDVIAQFPKGYGNLEDMGFQEGEPVTVIGKFESIRGFSEKYYLKDCYIVPTSESDREELEYFNRNNQLLMPTKSKIIKNKTYTVNELGEVYDTGHIPYPIYFSITLNTVEFIEYGSGYRLKLNVTYHFPNDNSLGNINSFHWYLNGVEGKTVLGEDPMVRGSYDTCLFELTDDHLECSQELYQYFDINKLREFDDIVLDIGGFKVNLTD